MSEQDKDFLWEMVVTALGPIVNENTMGELKKEFDHEIDQIGYVEITNKSAIRASLVEGTNEI
jgi:hypothetical protein